MPHQLNFYREVKQLILVKNTENTAHDSVLIVTGSQFTQASLSEPGKALFSLNHSQVIADSCKQLFAAKRVSVEVDRIDLCASHVHYVEDEARQLVEPYHNLFALVLLRKQVQNAYGHE